MKINKWQTLNKEFVGNFKIFDLYYCDRVHPIKNTSSRFVSLESPNWVNIIPITNDKKIIMVEQYRHGTDDVSLEIPAGLIEKGEFHRIAAERECAEETGFVGNGEAEILGFVEPNPAFLGNKCYHYVWFDCEKKFEQNLDENELINIKMFPLADLKDLINSGAIRHSLVISAFMYFNMKYRDIWNF